MKRSPCCSTTSGRPKARVRFCEVSDRTCRDDLPGPQQQRVREAGRDLLDVVGDHDGHGRRRILREDGQGADELLASAEVQAGGGLVQQQQLGVGHERTGGQHALALACRERRERALGEVVDAERGQQLAGAVEVHLVVLLAPAAGHAVAGGDDDVEGLLRLGDGLGELLAGEADEGAQLEHVGAAQALAEDVDAARRRVQARGQEAEHRGLAGAVGTQHHPPLPFGDLDVDVVEEIASGAADDDIVECGCRGHAPSLTPFTARPAPGARRACSCVGRPS